MATSPNAESRHSLSVPVWRMPITLENYPNSDPCVTDEEAILMDLYATPAIMSLVDLQAQFLRS